MGVNTVSPDQSAGNLRNLKILCPRQIYIIVCVQATNNANCLCLKNFSGDEPAIKCNMAYFLPRKQFSNTHFNTGIYSNENNLFDTPFIANLFVEVNNFSMVKLLY